MLTKSANSVASLKFGSNPIIPAAAASAWIVTPNGEHVLGTIRFVKDADRWELEYPASADAKLKNASDKLWIVIRGATGPSEPWSASIHWNTEWKECAVISETGAKQFGQLFASFGGMEWLWTDGATKHDERADDVFITVVKPITGGFSRRDYRKHRSAVGFDCEGNLQFRVADGSWRRPQWAPGVQVIVWDASSNRTRTIWGAGKPDVTVAADRRRQFNAGMCDWSSN